MRYFRCFLLAILVAEFLSQEILQYDYEASSEQLEQFADIPDFTSGDTIPDITELVENLWLYGEAKGDTLKQLRTLHSDFETLCFRIYTPYSSAMLKQTLTRLTSLLVKVGQDVATENDNIFCETPMLMVSVQTNLKANVSFLLESLKDGESLSGVGNNCKILHSIVFDDLPLILDGPELYDIGSTLSGQSVDDTLSRLLLPVLNSELSKVYPSALLGLRTEFVSSSEGVSLTSRFPTALQHISVLVLRWTTPILVTYPSFKEYGKYISSTLARLRKESSTNLRVIIELELSHMEGATWLDYQGDLEYQARVMRVARLWGSQKEQGFGILVQASVAMIPWRDIRLTRTVLPSVVLNCDFVRNKIDRELTLSEIVTAVEVVSEGYYKLVFNLDYIDTYEELTNVCIAVNNVDISVAEFDKFWIDISATSPFSDSATIHMYMLLTLVAGVTHRFRDSGGKLILDTIAISLSSVQDYLTFDSVHSEQKYVDDVQSFFPNDTKIAMACKIEMGNQQLIRKLHQAVNKQRFLSNPTKEKSTLSKCDILIWEVSLDNMYTYSSLVTYLNHIQPQLVTLTKTITEIKSLIRNGTTNAVSVSWKWLHSVNARTCSGNKIEAMPTWEFWDVWQHWAEVNSVLLIEENAFESVTDAYLSNGRWTVLSDKELTDKLTYAETEHEFCVSWDPGRITEGISFNSLFGVNFHSGNVKNAALNDNEISLMLRFVFQKFVNVELTLPACKESNQLFQRERSILNDITKLPEFQNRTLPQIYLSIEQSDCLFHSSSFKLLQELLEHGSSTNWSVKGIHFLWNPPEKITELYETITLLKRMRNPETEIRSKERVQAGLLLEMSRCNELGFIKNVTESNKEIRILLNTTDYIICTFSVPDQNEDWNYQFLYYFFNPIRFLQRRLSSNFPTLTIMIRLAGIPSSNSSDQFLRFWRFANDFSATNNIPFFMSPPFDYETMTTTSGSKNGWWKISDYKDLINVAVYTEKEAEYLGRNTERPQVDKISEKSWLIIWISSGSVMLIIMLVAAFVLLAVTFGNQRKILSDKEVAEILSNREVLRTLFGSGSKGTEFKYDQATFEIPRHEINIDNYTVLGSGKFGIIYKCKVEKLGAKPAACKIPIANDKETLKSVLGEVQIMSYVGSHSNVVNFIGACTKEVQKGNIYIITELCANGSLQTYLRNKRRRLVLRSEDLLTSQPLTSIVELYQMHKFCSDIATGMDYIAMKKVIHGDLSSRNVLLDEHFVCKIGDFGLSRKLKNYKDLYVKQDHSPLPWRWMALETLERMEFSCNADIWSFGVTAWEIYSLGDLPYCGVTSTHDFIKDLKSGMRLEKPEHAPNDIFNVMLECWKVHPEQRPAFHVLHQFFSSLCNMEYSRIA